MNIIRIISICLILALVTYTILLYEEVKIHRVTYEQYFLIGYLRATKDDQVIDKYIENHGTQNMSFYCYIIRQAVKDIRNQIYKGIDAPTSITLEN